MAGIRAKNAGRGGAREAGNAVIYVLLVIALFAALAFVLSRQHSNEQSVVTAQGVNMEAAQIIQVSNQVKQAVDEMMYGGSKISDADATKNLNFCQPSHACYGAGANLHKIFHPEGGGVVLPTLPSEAISKVDNNPPGWYLGAFNNVAWTPTAAKDVLLVAHQLTQAVCAQIDLTLTGDATIPSIAAPLPTYLISATDADGNAQHTDNPNADLDATACPNCDGHASLCVTDGTYYDFYNVIEQQ